jgi:hypothetical protein
MIIIAVIALVLAFIIYIPIAIAKIEPRIPGHLKSRGIDTQQEYKEYLEYNKRFK